MVIEMIALRSWSRLPLRKLGVLRGREVFSWRRDIKISKSNKR